MLDKLTSGRFIFTVISALVFAQMAISEKISGDQAMSIIILIIGFYFNRADRQPIQGGKDEKITTVTSTSNTSIPNDSKVSINQTPKEEVK